MAFKPSLSQYFLQPSSYLLSTGANGRQWQSWKRNILIDNSCLLIVFRFISFITLQKIICYTLHSAGFTLNSVRRRFAQQNCFIRRDILIYRLRSCIKRVSCGAQGDEFQNVGRFYGSKGKNKPAREKTKMLRRRKRRQSRFNSV